MRNSYTFGARRGAQKLLMGLAASALAPTALAQTLPLRLVSVDPPAFGRMRSRPEILFQRTVDPATWGGIDLYVAAKHAITTKGTGANNNRVVLTPTAPLVPGAEVSLLVPASVRSTDGQPLSQPWVFDFHAAAGAGPGTFAGDAPTDLATGTTPADVQACDFDRDGDADACVVSPATNTLSVLINNGTGRLVAPPSRRVSGLTGCDRVRCADLDRDGDADLVVSSSTANQVWVLVNGGTGTFGAPLSVGSGWDGPRCAAAKPNAATGFLDIYVADAGNNRIRRISTDGVVTNTAGYQFEDIASPGGPVDAAVADFDNDGDYDVAAACRDNGQIAIIRWQLGMWGLLRTVPTGTGSSPVGVEAGDLDADGRADLVISCAGDDGAGGGPLVRSSVQWWSSRRPTAAPRLVGRAKTSEARNAIDAIARIADVDGDGDLDVLYTEDAAFITCLSSGGTNPGFTNGGSPSARGVDKNGQDCTGPRKGGHLAVADFDGDSDLDAVVCFPDAAAVGVRENKPVVQVNHNPFQLQQMARPVGPIKWMAPEALDALTYQKIVLHDDHGRAHTTSTGATLSAGSDGSVELLLPAVQKIRQARYSATVPAGKTLTGKATRGFTFEFSTRPDPSDGVPASDGSSLTLATTEISTMGDWDGDGGNDMITVRKGCRTCGWDIKQAPKLRLAAGWSPPTTISATSILDFTPSLIRAADLDADGHLDVVIAGIVTALGPGGGPRIKVFDGATGALVEIDDYAIPEAAVDIVLVDLDLDGGLDVVVATANTVEVKGCKCVTRSNISNNRSIPVAGPIRAIACDLGSSTQEASLWLLVGGGAGGGPRVRRIPVDRTGALRPDEATTIMNLPAEGASISLGDLDGDEAVEAIVPVPSRVAIKVKGTGAERNFPTTSNPVDVGVMDLDGDGAADLVAACPGSSSLWVGLGNGDGTLRATYVVPVNDPPTRLWVNDCDDDGRADVVTRGQNGAVYFLETGPRSPLDLIITDPTAIAPGTYNSITVLDSGVAIMPPLMGGPPAVTASTMRVRSGGAIKGNVLINRFFTLEAGSAIEIANASGLHTTGGDGPVQGIGTRSFSSGAGYAYVGTGAQETGPGLPATVGALWLGNDLTQLSLTQALRTSKKGYDYYLASRRLPGAGKVSVNDFNFGLPPGGPKKRLISNGLLTLESGPDGTATLDVANIQVVGEATVETYLGKRPSGATARSYRQYSPPVSSTAVGHVTTTGYTPIVNPAYNTALSAADRDAVRPFPDVFTFSERNPWRGTVSSGASWSDHFLSPDNLADAAPLGRGMSMYVPYGVTWAATGLVPPGDVTISGLTYTTDAATGAVNPGTGWHLLGNPYPSVLCWDSVDVPAGISSAVYVWESAGGSNGRYLVRQNGAGTLADGDIGVGQAFWVQVTDPAGVSGGLLISDKATKKEFKGHITLIKREVPRPRLTLTLAAGGLPAQDEATLTFQSGATAAPDAAFDAARPGRNVGLPTLAMLAPDGRTELAINSMADTDLAAGATVELLLDVPAAGAYTLAVGQLANLAGASVVLVDRATAHRHDLTTTSAVCFRTAQPGEVRGRFAVEINGGRVLGTSSFLAPHIAFTLWPNPAHTAARLTGAAPLGAVVVLDATGRTVLTASADADGAATLAVGRLTPGLYVVRAGAASRRLVVE